MGTRRKETQQWDPWFNFLDDGKTVQCVFCKGTIQYKRERCFNHYGLGAKSTKAICSKAPISVKRRFATCAYVVPARMSPAEIWGTDEVPTMGFNISSPRHATPNNTPGPCIADNNEVNQEATTIPARQSGAGSCSVRSNSLRQQQMNEAFNIAKRKELDETWASFFYEANVPFNVVRHPSFIRAVRATSQAGFDYGPPAYNAIRTIHLEPKRKQVETDIRQKTDKSIEKYGATICTDGWDNVVHRPLMNIMLTCPAGDIFLGSVDTTGNKKTKEYIARELKNFIEQVGPNLITQVCTDNAANMLGAMDDVVDRYPHIYKQGCAAHALDLLLEDWAKIPQFNDLIMRARRVCLYIRNHHVTMALFREHSSNKSLVVPAETRFACNFLMISRMLEVRNALEAVVNDARWTEYTNTLFNRQNGHRSLALAALVKNTILEGIFWHRCRNYKHMVEDVLIALRLFDGREPAMGRAWHAMNNLKKHILRLREPPFSLPRGIADELEDNFTNRWEMMTTDLHHAGALLNPYLRDVPEIQENGDAKRALNRVFRRLGEPLGIDFNELMAEMEEYEERTGPYSAYEAPDIREAHMQPHQWWHRVGGRALPKLAMRVLSLTCSASSCERNWSMYSFVHNKTRNRLGVKKAEALVYIYANSRLLRQRAGADPLRWYENNIFSEDSDASEANSSDSEDDEDGDDADGYELLRGEDLWRGRDERDEGPRDQQPPQNDPRARDTRVFNWNDSEEDVLEQGRHHSNTPPAGHDTNDRVDYESNPDYDDVHDDNDDSDGLLGNILEPQLVDNNVVVNTNSTNISLRDTVVSQGDGPPTTIQMQSVHINTSARGGSTTNHRENLTMMEDTNRDTGDLGHINPIRNENTSLVMNKDMTNSTSINAATMVNTTVGRTTTVNAYPTDIRDTRASTTMPGVDAINIVAITNLDVCTNMDKDDTTHGSYPIGARTTVVVDATTTTAMRESNEQGPGSHRNNSNSMVTALRRAVKTVRKNAVTTSTQSMAASVPIRRCVGATLVNVGNATPVRRMPPRPSEARVHRNPPGQFTSRIQGRRRTKDKHRGIGEPVSNVERFLDTDTPGSLSAMPVIRRPRGPEVRSDADDPTAKRRKKLITTRVGNLVSTMLRNSGSEVEGIVDTNYGDEDELARNGDDEGGNESEEDRTEAPNDDTFRGSRMTAPFMGTNRRSERLRRQSDVVESANRNE